MLRITAAARIASIMEMPITEGGISVGLGWGAAVLAVLEAGAKTVPRIKTDNKQQIWRRTKLATIDRSVFSSRFFTDQLVTSTFLGAAVLLTSL